MTTLDNKWHLLLLGSRNLIGQLNDDETVYGDQGFNFKAPTLSPVYQLEKRPTPVTVVDASGKKVQSVQLLWTIMGVAEFDSILSVEVPVGSIMIPISSMSDGEQKMLTTMVTKIVEGREVAMRKARIDAEAAALANGGFGGGARSDG